MSELDRSAHPGVFESEGVLDRCIRVLKAAKDGFGLDGLSAGETARILTEKFRISTTANAVRSAFDRSGDVIDRTPSDEGGYRYRLMAAGEAYLANPEASRPGRTARRTLRRRKANAAGAGATIARNSETGKRAGPDSARSRAKTGPMESLLQLAESGFFATPKKIGEIQKQLEQRLALKFRTNELSPALLNLVRNVRLSRAKGSDGQYTYCNP